MDIKPILYCVDYYCDADLIAHQEPTQFLPQMGQVVSFSKNGDAYTAMPFYVDDVNIVIPESDEEIYLVNVQLVAQ